MSIVRSAMKVASKVASKLAPDAADVLTRTVDDLDVKKTLKAKPKKGAGKARRTKNVIPPTSGEDSAKYTEVEQFFKDNPDVVEYRAENL